MSDSVLVNRFSAIPFPNVPGKKTPQVKTILKTLTRVYLISYSLRKHRANHSNKIYSHFLKSLITLKQYLWNNKLYKEVVKTKVCYVVCVIAQNLPMLHNSYIFQTCRKILTFSNGVTYQMFITMFILQINSSAPSENDRVFNFGESRVDEYLRTMSGTSGRDVDVSTAEQRTDHDSDVTMAEPTPTEIDVVATDPVSEMKERRKRGARNVVHREPTRRSERIRRLEEIDEERLIPLPVPTTNSRKRKLSGTRGLITDKSLESPKSKIRKKQQRSEPKTKRSAQKKRRR